jgi:hypothetical protein
VDLQFTNSSGSTRAGAEWSILSYPIDRVVGTCNTSFTLHVPRMELYLYDADTVHCRQMLESSGGGVFLDSGTLGTLEPTVSGGA